MMIQTKLKAYPLLLLLFVLSWPGIGLALEQSPANPAPPASTEPAPKLRTPQLLEVQSALKLAEDKLKTLKKATAKTTQQQDPDLFEDLAKQKEEVERLQQSLEKIAAGGLTMQTMNAEEPPFDWQQELIGITQPVLESLKELTNKPRQTAELRTSLERIDAQQQLLQKGLASIERESKGTEDAKLKTRLESIRQEWQQQLANLGREQTAITTQLQSIDEESSDWRASLSAATDSFFAGRALTLFIAIVSAVGVWLLFRLLNRSLWHRQSNRRSSPLYRFLMYAFHAFSTIFIVFTVLTVFYLREDVLLLGLALIALVAGLLSLQRALPRFLKEVNLLLNLGSAREGERVLYNGVPYRVQSLNVFTILSNPYLKGIQRLPLEQIAGLYSRPGAGG
ncbi:MAG: hypothetical protein R3E89_15715 [Thiolinea sp.]